MDAEKTFTEVVNHSETTQEHELVVDGSNLKEKKVLDHLVRDNEEGPYQTKLVHTRWIDDDYYKVEEVEQTEESNEMTEERSRILNSYCDESKTFCPWIAQPECRNNEGSLVPCVQLDYDL